MVLQAIQSAIQRGEIERVLFVDDATLPDNFDSAEQWPECSKIINDIRDTASVRVAFMVSTLGCTESWMCGCGSTRGSELYAT